MAKRANDAGGEQETVVWVNSARQRAYLVTVHTSKKDGATPFVTVQASHSNQCRRFDDLASAFDYLSRLNRSDAPS